MFYTLPHLYLLYLSVDIYRNPMQISWVGQSTKHHGATPIQDGIFIISIQVLRCPILYMFPLFIEISKIEHGVKITLATGYVRLWSCSRLPVESVGNCSSVRTQFVGCGSPTSAAVLCSPLYFFFYEPFSFIWIKYTSYVRLNWAIDRRSHETCTARVLLSTTSWLLVLTLV